MSDRKPLPEALTSLLHFDDARQERVVSQIIDRACKGESFLADEIVGLKECHKGDVAERLKQICTCIWFFAEQVQPPRDQAA